MNTNDQPSETPPEKTLFIQNGEHWHSLPKFLKKKKPIGKPMDASTQLDKPNRQGPESTLFPTYSLPQSQQNFAENTRMMPGTEIASRAQTHHAGRTGMISLEQETQRPFHSSQTGMISGEEEELAKYSEPVHPSTPPKKRRTVRQPPPIQQNQMAAPAYPVYIMPQPMMYPPVYMPPYMQANPFASEGYGKKLLSLGLLVLTGLIILGFVTHTSLLQGITAAFDPFHMTHISQDSQGPAQPVIAATNFTDCGFTDESQFAPTQLGYIQDPDETSLLAAYSVVSGTDGPTLIAWYEDQSTMLLGAGNVSPMKHLPEDSITNPNFGDTTTVDADHFSYAPAVYINDTTHVSAPLITQIITQTSYRPDTIYGQWKALNTADPGQLPNGTTLNPGAPPANAQKIQFGTDGTNERTAELIWHLSTGNGSAIQLLAGHTYQFMFSVHDGDGSNEIGINCAIVHMA